MWSAIILILITVVLLSRSLGCCLTKPKTDPFCLVSNVTFREFFFSSRKTEGCVHSRPGWSSHCCSPWLTGVRGPWSSSVWLQPKPLPVLKRAEGDSRVSRTCQRYRGPSVGCGGTAGKFVTNQKQMTLTWPNHFSSRSLLTFSKVHLVASQLFVCVLTGSCDSSVFRKNNLRSQEWRKGPHLRLELSTTVWSLKNCCVFRYCCCHV